MVPVLEVKIFYTMIDYFFLFYIIMMNILLYFLWEAPLLDESGNVIVKEKKLKDLFKKKKYDNNN